MPEKPIETELTKKRFTDTDDFAKPTKQKGMVKGRNILPNAQSMGIGSGDSSFHADISGIWLGAKTFALAPFSVDMDGNVIANLITLSGYVPYTGATADVDLGSNSLIAYYIAGQPEVPFYIQAGVATNEGVGLQFAASPAASGTDANGGDIIFMPSKGDGAGENGHVSIINPGGDQMSVIFDPSLLSLSNKIFTFPNKSGTFALLDDIISGSNSLPLAVCNDNEVVCDGDEIVYN